MRRERSSWFVVALALLWSATAWAIPITFSFTGTVTDDPFGLASFGAPISGSYTFESTATDAIPGPSTGSYASSGAAYGFTANVDGTSYSVSGSLTVNTANNILGLDQYGAIALDSALTLELFLQDASGTALSSDGLPLTPPALAAFDFRQFRLFGTSAEFLGNVTSLVCTAGCDVVPPGTVAEPGVLALLALALVLMALGCSARVPGALRRTYR